MSAILTWVMRLAPQSGAEDEFAKVLHLISEHPPVWTVEPVDLTETTLTSGGTAQPASRLYRLLPEWIALRFATRAFGLNGTDLRFRAVSREQGAELVSWPPQTYVRRGRSWFYSGVLTTTVQTVAFAPCFRVHVSAHLRRWETSESFQYGRRRGATVLLDVPLPWTGPGSERLRLSRNTMSYDRRLGSIAWRGRSAVPMLSELDLVRTYPQPDDLIGDPEAWIRGQGDIAAAIVHSTVLGTHEVGGGLMPGERAELDALVEEAMPPALRRVPDLTRAVRTPKPTVRPDRAPARRAALRPVLGTKPLEIMIVWKEEATREALIAALRGVVGLPSADEQQGLTSELEADGMHVDIRTVRVGDLGWALDVDEDSADSCAVADAVRSRRAEVAARFADPARGRRLAFVEIGGQNRFPELGTDPKQALRKGFADAGMLSQFIQIEEDADATVAVRARWAVLDGLRQLGAVVPDRHQAEAGVPADLQYVALWLVRGKAGWRLVVVRIRPGYTEHPMQGWDEAANDWVPYSDLLIRLAIEPADDGGLPWEQRCADIQRQIRVILNRFRDRPTLLLVSAGNLRRAWPGLDNGNLVKDMLSFAVDEPHQRAAAYGPDLRIVVVRDDCGREETPQWYGFGAQAVGFAAGVWLPVGAGNDHRVFGSAADASVVAKQLPRALRKLVLAPGSEWACRKTAWNPQLLELTVLACLSKEALAAFGRDEVTPDDPAVWAALTHQLRVHDDYQPLKLPLPLHLAALAEEYARAD
jgi:pPIWI_RE module N-terminal domain/RNaseH domain of pPIWI_RE/MID domain of pPIWI_RE